MNLIDEYRHKYIIEKCKRSQKENYPRGWGIDEGNCYDIEEETATGRAVCRLCGEKIKKGERCWSFGFDFSGYGSYTTQKVYIHMNCK